MLLRKGGFCMLIYPKRAEVPCTAPDILNARYWMALKDE